MFEIAEGRDIKDIRNLRFSCFRLSSLDLITIRHIFVLGCLRVRQSIPDDQRSEQHSVEFR